MAGAGLDALMRATFTLSADVSRSARVMQTAGMTDIQPDTSARTAWDVDVPIEDRPWNVGLVIGPSGSGKSSLARRLWPGQLSGGAIWSPDAAILDDFPQDMPVREVTKLLVDVGLGSVPAWLRPCHTLSMGEAFSADIARALATTDGRVVVDEFTSVVDRQLAKVPAPAGFCPKLITWAGSGGDGVIRLVPAGSTTDPTPPTKYQRMT
jgi:ABC-type microcin C transport system duplicated ATPase subunit YejF